MGDVTTTLGLLRQIVGRGQQSLAAHRQHPHREVLAPQRPSPQLPIQDGDEDQFIALETEAEGLQEQRKALDEALSVWPAELMAQAGCVVHVGTNGAATVKCGLIRPEDRGDMALAAQHGGEDGADAALVSMPICEGIHQVLYAGVPAAELVRGLMTRPIRAETD